MFEQIVHRFHASLFLPPLLGSFRPLGFPPDLLPAASAASPRNADGRAFVRYIDASERACGSVALSAKSVLFRRGAMVWAQGSRRVAMHRGLIGLVILFVTARAALAQPAQVIIIRHAEKPEAGNDLSLQGRERAAALAPFFLETDAVLKFKNPVAIYAQAQKRAGSSLRSVNTVKPLANKLGLTINENFERDDYKNMVKEIMGREAYEGHTVLICWEHKVIPNMAQEFGVMDAPKVWHGREFDRVWIITFRPDEKPVFQNLPQRLIYGDSDD
jgi:hypothetical protein